MSLTGRSMKRRARLWGRTSPARCRRPGTVFTTERRQHGLFLLSQESRNKREEHLMSTKSTREHLLDVGVGLMHRNGYNATGLSDILKAADVPKGSFYHHFSSKEDFAAAALAQYVAHEVEHAASVLNDSRTPPLKRLKRYFTDLTKTYGQAGEIPGCMMGRFSLELAVESPQLRKQISVSFGVWQQKIAAVVQEAIEQ